MELLKKILKSILFGSVMGLAVALFSQYLFQDLFDRLECVSYYMRSYWENNETYKQHTEKDHILNSSIGIIDIDDRSMEKLGLYWNWDRSFQAKMISRLSANFPAAIVYDVLFFKPEDTMFRQRLTTLLDQSGKGPHPVVLEDKVKQSLLLSVNYDQLFIDATKKAGVVFHGLLLADEADYNNFALSQIKHKMALAYHDSLNPGSALLFSKEKTATIEDSKSILDGIFPDLARAARGIGHIDMIPNEDGVIREVPLMFRFGKFDPVYLPISVRVMATLFGTKNEDIVFEPNKYIDIGKPFKVFRDSTGAITCSYPNITPLQIRALCDKGAEIMSCKPGQSDTVTVFCAATRDTTGRFSLELKSTGVFPPEVTSAFLGTALSKALDLEPGDSLSIGSQMSIRRDSSDQWIIAAPYGDQEWTCSQIEMETLFRITPTDISFIRPGERKLIFHNLIVQNLDGELVSTIPVLRNESLRELCLFGWDQIAQMPKGSQAEFGKTLRIPLQPHNRHIITYFGPKATTFPHYSFYDVMENRAHGSLEGKIFIVGSTAKALFDIKPAPHDRNYPGLEVHASLMNSFLKNTFITRLSAWQDFCILLLVAMTIGVISFLFKPLIGGILTIVSIMAYFLFAMSIFGTSHLWIEIARPLIAIMLSFTGVMAYRYITEEKDRKFLQNTFKQYLSPALIDIMYKQRQQPKLGGDEGVRTAFFTDIQGFSTFSEKLGSPTRLVELLNEYLSEMTDILLKRYGTLDKYEGDAIIAFFGAPMPMDDHAYQACLTALDMQAKLGDLRAQWKSQADKWPQIVHEMRMRIGINTGPLVTGNMGSKVRMNYTMMGDAVNLAARLESAAKQYGIYTVISNFTYEMVRERFVVRQLDKVTVVGKSESVTMFELICEKGKCGEQTGQLLALYEQGLTHYYAREWDKAIEVMTQADQLEPNRLITPKNITPSKKIIGYCEEYKLAPPPPEWDGVRPLTSK